MLFMNPFLLWEVITEASSLFRLATCNKIQSQTKAFTSGSPGSSTLKKVIHLGQTLNNFLHHRLKTPADGEHFPCVVFDPEPRSSSTLTNV